MHKVFICNNNKMKIHFHTQNKRFWLSFLKFRFCSGPKHPEVINFADVTDADVVLLTLKPRSALICSQDREKARLKVFNVV